MTVLRRGGSAVDAAIAVEAMLSLVEPQSSGLGGGAFMTHYDARTSRVTVYDGRETAPAGATPDMFLDDNGQPLPFRTAVVSGRATGVPGVVRMLDMAHRAHGRLPWSGLFGDAERTARDGFIVSPRLGPDDRQPLRRRTARRTSAPISRKATAPCSTPAIALRNPAYADFLRRLAAAGPGRALSRADRRSGSSPGSAQGELPSTMTQADLAAYRPIEREPLCRPYPHLRDLRAAAAVERGRRCCSCWRCWSGPTSPSRGPADPQGWFLFAEASRLMYADRDQYVGDPAFVSVPGRGPARSGLCRLARGADRRAGRAAARPPARRRARRPRRAT